MKITEYLVSRDRKSRTQKLELDKMIFNQSLGKLVFFQDSKVWKVRVRFFFKAAKIGKVRVSIYFENCKVWKVRVKTKMPKFNLTPKGRLKS